MSGADSSRAVNKLIAPIARAMRSMVLRGVVSLVNDATALQRVQVQLRAMPQPGGAAAPEMVSDIEVMRHYGLTAVPLAGAETVMLAVGGVKDHGIVIAIDDRRHRPSGLQPGDVMLYDHRGQTVHLGADGITVTSPIAVTIDTPKVTLTGDLELTNGSISVPQGDVTTANGLTLNTHTHMVTAVGQQTQKGQG